MTTTTTPRTCDHCGNPLLKRQLRACSVPCMQVLRAGVKPNPAARPGSVAPPIWQWTGNDLGATVRCAGPGEEHYRERGKFCPKCEWRAFVGSDSE